MQGHNLQKGSLLDTTQIHAQRGDLRYAQHTHVKGSRPLCDTSAHLDTASVPFMAFVNQVLNTWLHLGHHTAMLAGLICAPCKLLTRAHCVLQQLSRHRV